MGTGKTVTVLTFLNNLELVGERGRSLVLAPKRVCLNVWPYEARKWDHLSHVDVSPIIGTPEERRMALQSDANIHAINYDNIPWLLHELGRKRWPYQNIIADEATRLKGFRLRQGTTRARYIGSIAHTGRVKRWINLTGTPSPNGLQDLWGPTFMLDAGERLGRSYNAFLQRWFAKDWSGFGVKAMPTSDIQIYDRLSDICLSVDHELDVLEPIESVQWVTLPPKAMRIYRDMESKMFAEIGDYDVEVRNAGNKSMKCLQIASGAAYVNRDHEWEVVHDEKLAALESVIEEFAGMPILVVYHWQPSLARILKRFKKARYLDDKKATENAWNRGEIPILVAHPKSAGHGLNLQDGGNVICFFDHFWSLEDRMQIIERIGPVRQAQAGHDRPVYIVNIAARGTNDALVIRRNKTKEDVQSLLLHAMKRGTDRVAVGVESSFV